MDTLHWLIFSPQGLWLRIAAGVAIFLLLALSDLARRGKHATRWREYLFLLIGVAVAILYGLLNNQLTVTISPEYFLYGKGVGEKITNPAGLWDWSLRWEAAKIGIEATWTAGLLVAVALLLANNPRPARPQLPYRLLLGYLLRVFVFAAFVACLFGLAGFLLMTASADFARYVVAYGQLDFLPPPQQARFVCAYGVHLGGYVGGLAATAAAVIAILRRRRTLAATGENSSPSPI